jgi:hypothetical protein
MQELHKISGRTASLVVGAILAGAATRASAKEWMARAGAESQDLGSQALAFLPNELWIHAPLRFGIAPEKSTESSAYGRGRKTGGAASEEEPRPAVGGNDWLCRNQRRPRLL